MSTQFLSIRNPGVADYRAFTLLGVSTTRNSGHSDTIGQFGSGSKLSIALLLRHGIEPIVVCGNLKLNFFVKEVNIKGQLFQQVCVKYSGKDEDGNTKNSTEDLGFTLEWGVQDWNILAMAMREFVSNAIDGSICRGGSYRDVDIKITDEPRAKAGHTTIYLPYNEHVQKMYSQLHDYFLHFRNPEMLKMKCLPKKNPDVDKVRIYKKGVLVCTVKGKSVYDYNLDNSLTLDESRNASEWNVKYAVAKSLKQESSATLATIIEAVANTPDLWEGTLDASYLTVDQWDTEDSKQKVKAVFQEAFTKVAGPKGVLSSNTPGIESFITEKGFVPFRVNSVWQKVLEDCGISSEKTVLSHNELEGKIISDPTEEMVSVTNKVWELFKTFNLTNNKECPGVKGFESIMEGGSQTFGYYIPGDNKIYLHTSLGGKLMFKVVLEEVVHYVTGASDNSRDIQDFLFNLITSIAY